MLLLLAGCLSSVLEAPYVLSTGLGEATGLAPSGRRSMLVASDSGLWEVDGEGERALLRAGATRAVTGHLSGIYALDGCAVAWGPLAPAGQPWTPTGHLPAQGVVDLQAWCDGLVLLASPRELTAWAPETGETFAFAAGLSGVRAVSLGPDGGCDEALVVTADAVLAVSQTGRRTLAAGLVAPRAAVADAKGRVWVVHGEPAVLARIDAGAAVEVARYLGDPRDLHFGTGGLLPPENAYLADGEGSLDYLRVPDN